MILGKILIISGAILIFLGIMDAFTVCNYMPCDRVSSSVVWDQFSHNLIVSDPWFTYPGIIILVTGLLVSSKRVQNWKLPMEKEAKAIEEIDKFPPIKRRIAINKIFRTCAGSLFGVSTISIAYLFRNYPTSFEETLGSFFTSPIMPVLLLTSVVAVTAGVLLWKIIRAGAILAIATKGLTITSMILIIIFTDNLYLSFAGNNLVLFTFYLVIAGYPIIYVYKFWKDTIPIIHKI